MERGALGAQPESQSEWLDDRNSKRKDVPLDPFHSTISSKAGTRVPQRTAKHRHAVIDATGISMQDLLSNKGPSVGFFSDIVRNGATPFMMGMRNS